MSELLSTSDAARELELTPARVRALASQGRLPAIKVGTQWLIERSAVVDRSLQRPSAGRPIEAHNAWALLFLASGLNPDWVGSVTRSRLRRSLRSEGLSGLAPRLGRRARICRFGAHPGEVAHVLDDERLVLSGVSAAGAQDLDILPGPEADGYLRASGLRDFVRSHALHEIGPSEGANVTLRVVPDSAWHLLGPIAPRAAVGLDLSEERDARSRRAGEMLLGELAEQAVR